jgi:cysteine desulfuration protein SufE
MTIDQIQEEIISDFSLFEDWSGKYEYIIDLGKNLPPLDEAHKKEENLVRGCQSRVWLTAKNENGHIVYKADSDAIITKGIIALLIKVLSGHKPEDIIQADLHFIPEIGLGTHLSPTRSNGLVNMVKQMKHYAIALLAKEKV